MSCFRAALLISNMSRTVIDLANCYKSIAVLFLSKIIYKKGKEIETDEPV